ncbi:MAG: histidinol dehydrogenase [Tagaea sp.]|nr:histidinol dehydrogenase [Tagaea sp.]
MPLRLDTRAKDFERGFARLLAAREDSARSVDGVVAAILAGVRQRGDAGLIAYTKRFDRVTPTPKTLRVGAAEIAAARKASDPRALKALAAAAKRIAAFHARMKPKGDSWRDAAGVELGWRWTALDSVGLYVPGGKAAYPSSVLMNAIPAKVAGVARLVVTVPAPDGKIAPLVLAACHVAGVDEIYKVGGAQAIAALAYGTKTIAPVDKIVGPGNAYVAAAKRMVFGKVGIDLIAGPSEVCVVADSSADPRWIAVDLLAQAEHDAAAQSVLIADDASYADAVAAAVDRELATHPRAAIAAASWRDHGAIVLVRDLADAPAIVDRLAPEHLQLACRNAARLAKRVRHAGAIFVGRHTPEALGDYLAGPNHVLPTSGAARFASGLGTADFMKRTTLIRADAEALARLADDGIALARAEGLASHAASLAIRTGRG